MVEMKDVEVRCRRCKWLCGEMDDHLARPVGDSAPSARKHFLERQRNAGRALPLEMLTNMLA